MFLDDKALNLLHISVCLSHTAHLQDEAVYLSLSAPIFICRLEKWMFHITSSKHPSCNMSPSFACRLDYLSHSVITSLSLFKPPTPSKIQMLQALIISHPCTCLCFTSGLSHSFLVFHLQLHSDVDSGDGNIKYILSGEGAGTIFVIDDKTGNIHATKTLDREEQAQYTLTAQAVDRDTNKPLEPPSQFIVKVQDINDNPPEFLHGPYYARVPEMSNVGE